MNRIDEKFKELRERGDKALIAYFTAGLPSVKENIDIIIKAEESGVDIVEIEVSLSPTLSLTDLYTTCIPHLNGEGHKYRYCVLDMQRVERVR